MRACLNCLCARSPSLIRRLRVTRKRFLAAALALPPSRELSQSPFGGDSTVPCTSQRSTAEESAPGRKGSVRDEAHGAALRAVGSARRRSQSTKRSSRRQATSTGNPSLAITAIASKRLLGAPTP